MQKKKLWLFFGLEIFNQDKECPNIINQLKKLKFTNKQIISIHYDSKTSGFLIFGSYPHEYQPNKYKEEQLITYYTEKEDDNKIKNFNMYPDEIICINYDKKQITISNSTKLIFEFDYGFFIGSSSYQEYIEENFFNELIDKDICYKANRTSLGGGLFYDIYSCKEENINDIKKFPKLKFYIKSTDTSFIFDFEDLFLKMGNRYYFMIIFEKYAGSYWIIGYPFFKKYEIVFDGDSKTVSYYNTNNIVDNKGGKTLKIIIIVILSFILSCGILGIGFYFGKEKYIQRKKRANELMDDEYDYISGEANTKGKEDERNKKIINAN